MLSVKEFCEKTGVSRRTIDTLRANGEGPAVTRIGRRVLISEKAAEEWLESRTEQPSTKERAS